MRLREADMSRLLCGIVGVALGAGLAFGAGQLGVLPHPRGSGDQAGHPADPHAGHGQEGDHEGEGEASHVVLAPEAIETFGVRIEAAKSCVLRPLVEVPARVSFDRERMAHVGFPLHGRVVEVLARLGDPVAKGAPLLRIDSAELGQAQAEVLRQRAALAAAGPNLELARAAHDRVSSLRKDGGGASLADVQAREAEVRTAEAARALAEAERAAAESRALVLGLTPEALAELVASGRPSARLTVTAPISGEIIARDVTLGEVVGPDRDALLTIADTSRFWVLAEVPESHLADLDTNAPATVLLADGGLSLEGRVALVPPIVDPATRTARVRVEIPACPGVLRDGLFVTARLARGRSVPEPQLAIPDRAVQLLDGVPSVFVPVPGEANAFEPRRVAVGPPVGGLVPVLSGLAEGEFLVTDGSFLLKAERGRASAKHEH